MLRRIDFEGEAARILRDAQGLRAATADDTIGVVIHEADKVGIARERALHGVGGDDFAEAAQIVRGDVGADGVTDESWAGAAQVGAKPVEVPDFEVTREQDIVFPDEEYS